MKKKGFTLVELIGVISLLGIISLIVVPLVLTNIKNSKEELYNNQINNIKLAMENWRLSSFDYKLEKGEQIYLTIGQLKKANLIDNDFRNPKTEQMWPNDMLVSVSYNTGYVYEVLDDTATFIDKYDYQTPYLSFDNGDIVILDVGQSYINPIVTLNKSDGTKQIVTDITPVLLDDKTSVNTSLSGVYSVKYDMEINGVKISAIQNVIVRDINAVPRIINIAGSSSNWSISKTFTLDVSNMYNASKYEYYLAKTESDIPTSSTQATSSSTSEVITITQLAKYVYFRIIDNKNNIGGWSRMTDCYVDPALISSWDGTFSYTGRSETFFLGEYIEINPNNTYKETVRIKTSDTNAKYYIGIAEFDEDFLLIADGQFMFISGSTTKLAKDLNKGDTVVYLEDVSGFINTSVSYQNGFMIWNYSDSNGYTYPKETYTRYNYTYQLYSYSSINQDNNTITLNNPWNGVEALKGTYLSQSDGGNVFNYGLLSYKSLTTEYQEFTNNISGVSNLYSNIKFRPGTKYIKFVLLHNYRNQGSETTTTDIANFTFDKID